MDQRFIQPTIPKLLEQIFDRRLLTRFIILTSIRSSPQYKAMKMRLRDEICFVKLTSFADALIFYSLLFYMITFAQERVVV